MSDDLRAILLDQVEKLLSDAAGPDLLRANERGEWPAALWEEAEALGLPLALVPESMGGAGLGWGDAAALWQLLGRHASPLPLGEGMIAAALLAAAGVAPRAGYLGLAVDTAPVVWGRRAAALVQVMGETVALQPGPATHQGRAGFAREPADAAAPGVPVAEGRLPPAYGPEAGMLAGALLNAARIAGALETVLAMTVDYANTRKQFGRPIGGFQAVQQLLARCAGEVAVAGVAAGQAGRAADRHGLAGATFEIASAKVVCGEAAHAGAEIVHQVHAAIGFTDDHALHLFTRRLWEWRDGFGAERVWARRIGEAALARGGAALWPDLTTRDHGEGEQ